MNRPSDYKHIAAWGRFMGSFGYYIRAEQHAAAMSGAPLNAIYRKAVDSTCWDSDFVWHTADEITAPNTLTVFNGICAEMKIKQTAVPNDVEE